MSGGGKMKLIKCLKFESPMIGYISRLHRDKLRKKYNFEEWHCYPLYEKKYILECIKLFDKNRLNTKGQLVEVGCGLGDIINNINWKGKKIGYDISEEVIAAANNRFTRTRFKVGSFNEIKEKNIECLIMINFIHGMDQDELKECIRKISNNKNVKYIMMDHMDRIRYSEYENACSGDYILGGKYELIDKSETVHASHGALRCIELWNLKK